jgi:hypothetical protein
MSQIEATPTPAAETNDIVYLPGEWLDETIPDTGQHPNAFIHREGDAWFLRPIEDGANREQEEFWRKLEHGDVIEFSVRETHGTWAITIEDWPGSETGTRATGGEAIPAAANCFFCVVNDYVEENLEDCVKAILHNDPEFRGKVSIDAYSWDDAGCWLFSVVDGKATFIQLDASHAIH